MTFKDLNITESILKAIEEKGLEDPLRVGYYTEIDMLVWAKKFYGDDFVEYLKRTYSPLNVVFRLAKETSLVLLNGGGFDGPYDPDPDHARRR